LCNRAALARKFQVSRQTIMRARNLEISKYIGSVKGTFGSVEEIDGYIASERASWD
jgi:hypothetical protein